MEKTMIKNHTATLFAILAAGLYALNIPVSKLLLRDTAPTMMAAFLYLGAGLGIFLLGLLKRAAGRGETAAKLTRGDLPYVIRMVVLDIAAPILLMSGIARTASSNVSLLNNFEIVATSLIAFLVFHEKISSRLWTAIGLVTISSILLSVEGSGALRLDMGAVLVLAAAVCWGFENNCTRMISNKSASEIVVIKGICSGLGSLGIAGIAGEPLPGVGEIALVMLLGFVAYGLSIDFYILAQKELGAAKTSAYYAIAPFIGVVLSLLILRETPVGRFYGALAIMVAATVLMVKDTITLQHTHLHTHTHSHLHSHGSFSHTHVHSHTHEHVHIHGHEETHTHPHGEHALESHVHSHGAEQSSDF